MEALKELKELGLDDNEIKVYLTCLADQGSSVKQISERTKLIRTTVYGVLKALLQKGLVSTVDKEGIMIFRATSPKELLNILDQKRAKIESILPRLEQYQNAIPCRYRVELFEGRSGVKAVTNDIISKQNETVKVIGVGQKWLEFSSSFTTIYYRKKRAANVHTKAILADSKEERDFLVGKKFINSEIRLIKNMDFGKTATYIYHDKVSFVIYDEDPRGFIVQDKEFNRIQNMLFDNLWNKLKK